MKPAFVSNDFSTLGTCFVKAPSQDINVNLGYLCVIIPKLDRSITASSNKIFTLYFIFYPLLYISRKGNLPSLHWTDGHCSNNRSYLLWAYMIDFIPFCVLRIQICPSTELVANSSVTGFTATHTIPICCDFISKRVSSDFVLLFNYSCLSYNIFVEPSIHPMIISSDLVQATLQMEVFPSSVRLLDGANYAWNS